MNFKIDCEKIVYLQEVLLKFWEGRIFSSLDYVVPFISKPKVDYYLLSEYTRM